MGLKMIRWGQPGQTNVIRPGEAIVPQYYGDGLGRIPHGGVVIGLPLLTDRYTTVSHGEHATLDRASAASIIDYEGFVRETLPHEFGFDGARRVENVVYTLGASGNDLTVGWVGVSGAVVKNSTTVTMSSSDTSAIEIASGAKVNTEYRISATMWVDSGTYDLRGYAGVGSGAKTINTTPLRIAFDVISSGAGGDLEIRNAIGQPGGDVHITGIQIEIVTDTAKAPGEFITPNDSACSDHDIAVRYYPHTNPNRVDANGVVYDDVAVTQLTTLKRCSVWDGSTNEFLNSSAPVTQDITTTAQDYTVSVVGPGDVTLTGTATGTATEGSPLTVTATAGTLTCTVNGSLDLVQVEAKSYATPHIFTSGAAATRLADDCQVTWVSGLVNDFVVGCKFNRIEDVTVTQNRFLLHVGDDANNRIIVFIGGGTKQLRVIKTNAAGGVEVTHTFTDLSVTHDIKIRASSTAGLSLFVNDVNVDSNATNLTDIAPTSTVLYIGQRLTGISFLNGNIGNTEVIKGDLTDQEVIDL